MTEEKLANPGALGLGSFALTTFILSMVNAEIVPIESIGMVLPMALFYGGMAQFCAGMWDMRRGDIFGGTCFSSFGAFWIGLALMILLESAGIISEVPPAGMAVFFIAWGIFAAYATVGAFKIAWGVVATFATLTILFFSLALGEFYLTVTVIAGYIGILCALCAWYCSAGILINTVFRREVIPLGHIE